MLELTRGCSVRPGLRMIELTRAFTAGAAGGAGRAAGMVRAAARVVSRPVRGGPSCSS